MVRVFIPFFEEYIDNIANSNKASAVSELDTVEIRDSKLEDDPFLLGMMEFLKIRR